MRTSCLLLLTSAWASALTVSEVESPRVRVRIVGADDSLGEAIEVAEVPADRTSGFPRMASIGETLIVAWTDPSAGYRVRTARLDE